MGRRLAVVLVIALVVLGIAGIWIWQAYILLAFVALIMLTIMTLIYFLIMAVEWIVTGQWIWPWKWHWPWKDSGLLH